MVSTHLMFAEKQDFILLFCQIKLIKHIKRLSTFGIYHHIISIEFISIMKTILPR